MGKGARCAVAAFVLLSSFLIAHGARAQRSGEQTRQFEGVSFDQKLGETIPLDLTFKNAAGKKVRLGQYFDGKRPVALVFAYFDCPMLCPLMLSGFTKTLKDMSWTPGQQFDVLTIDFNHREGPKLARREKKKYLKQLGKKGAGEGWHFLTGDEVLIKKLADAVGFHFRWFPEKKEYAHPTGVVFLSGTGKISRYLFGIGPPDLTASKMRQALVEASNGKVGNAIDQALLYCFQFDPNSNSYVADAFNIMRLGGLLTMILLGGVLFIFWRRERRKIDEANRLSDAAVSNTSTKKEAHGA